MYNHVSLGLKYLRYFITAENGKGHGIHSPFVFDFITLVLNDSGEYYCYGILEEARTNLMRNKTELEIQDWGAGSRTAVKSLRKVSEIAKSSLKPAKYSRLLFRMANYFKCKSILELGTSLGITTSYLAYSNYAGKVVTLEGATAVANLAKHHFSNLGLTNINLIEGNFDKTLQKALGQFSKLDFVYIDGNHRIEPTLRYFNQIFSSLHYDSVVVLDDIHWSSEMEQAWEAVKSDPRVTLTIDLFFIGIVFLKPDFKVKQHFSIRF